MNAAPAFKEWQAIVGALVAGEQVIILRKGGIAEEHGTFTVAAPRFWLFPTAFHAQREKTKPSMHRYFAPGPSGAANRIELPAYADVVQARFLSHWSDVARLDGFHGWTESTVRDRFHGAAPPGLHVLVVRVHRLHTPVAIDVTPAMGGCKSWTDVPPAFADHPASPVLDDATFAARVAALGLGPAPMR